MMKQKDVKRRIVSCITCCIGESIANSSDVEGACWGYTWDIHRPAEEQAAFSHAEENPRHIMIEGDDWEQRVNGAND